MRAGKGVGPSVAVIGAGMAGASLAAEIAAHATVTLFEAEAMPGYHATGRSAAFWEECYGGPGVVPLTLASGPYLERGGFLSPRGSLYLAREQDEGAIARFFEDFAQSGARFERIDRARLERLVPGLRAQWDRAIFQPRCADIDVAALHQHYLSRAREGGATLCCNARLIAVERREEQGWRLEFADGRRFECDVLVDAAGAWATQVAAMAGASAIAIRPFRRTVAQLRCAPSVPDRLPLCLDIGGRFYFKPEHGKLWLSPHDETPSAPVDAAPEELDVAIAIERLGEVVDWSIEAVERKWAGLRSFAPDRLPVIGYDPKQTGFFWFAGQGGFGIQTAPAAARLGAQALLGLPRDAMTDGIDASVYAPERFD